MQTAVSGNVRQRERCVGKYAYEKGLVKKETITLETGAGIKVLALDVDKQGKVRKVRVDMGKPILAAEQIPMKIDEPLEKVVNQTLSAAGQNWQFTAVSMGNPHCVIFLPEVENLPLSGSVCHRTPRAFPRESTWSS